MLTQSEALCQLNDLMASKHWKSDSLADRANNLDLICEGLGKLYLDYMIRIGKPTDFVLKATDLIVANSTKLGRILK